MKQWKLGRDVAVVLDISAPDDRVCNDCANYDPSECVCMLDWTTQHPLTIACELYDGGDCL